MDIQQAYNVYNKVSRLDRVTRCVESLCKMKVEHNLEDSSVWFSKNVEKDGKYYPINVSIHLSDLINSLRMMEETLTQEVEDL